MNYVYFLEEPYNNFVKSVYPPINLFLTKITGNVL